MKYLSVCSGIEAASVAFEPLGWKPLAFSEIEAFPRAVLQHHYPDTPLHGDFTKLKDEPWIVDADMLCGGTPCQAFSVAGLRQSLADDRGNLTLQFVKLADAIDNFRRAAGREPAWILWENVPGVLNTGDNAFGAFLGGLCGRDEPIAEPADGWTRAGVVDGPARVAAWRVMDAQHFGLAQRRQRVFVLALGGAGRWAAPDALLPIIESSRWHPAPSRPSREGVAPTISARTSGGGGLGTDFDLDGGLIQGQYAHVPDCADTVTSKFAKGAEVLQQGAKDGGNCIPVVMAHGQANAEIVSDGELSLTCNHEAHIVFDPAQITSVANRSNPKPGDPYHTLHQSEPPMLIRMREGKEGGGKGPLVSEDQSLTLATANDQVLAVRTANTNANGHGVADGITHTLDQAQGVAAVALRGRDGGATAELSELPSALRASQGGGDKAHVLAYAIQERAVSENVNAGPQGKGWQEDVAFTMEARHHAQSVSSGMQVRRLTPVECERLQGFPDGYTAIPWRGKPADQCPDGPRYKALGNSWAVNVVKYIGQRIQAVKALPSAS